MKITILYTELKLLIIQSKNSVLAETAASQVINNYFFKIVLIGITLALAGSLFYRLSRLVANRNHEKSQLKHLESDILQLEENISDLANKNNWLLTEMHHRVKNNLQILSSLLNSQLAFIKDKPGREALFQSKHRLFALSLVHQKLFQHASESVIEMSCCI